MMESWDREYHARDGFSDPFWAARREHAYLLRTKHKLILDAIAERLGVTRERIRQMIRYHERKLREGQP